MDRLLVFVALGAIVIVGYRVAARRCRAEPSRRPWFAAGAVATLCGAGLLIPWVMADLDPPWSESPAGIFVYLGKAVVVGVPLLFALGALAGAIHPGRSDSSDS